MTHKSSYTRTTATYTTSTSVVANMMAGLLEARCTFSIILLRIHSNLSVPALTRIAGEPGLNMTVLAPTTMPCRSLSPTRTLTRPNLWCPRNTRLTISISREQVCERTIYTITPGVTWMYMGQYFSAGSPLPTRRATKWATKQTFGLSLHSLWTNWIN